MLKLYRTFYWNDQPIKDLYPIGAPLYVNRDYQGTGRFDLEDDSVIYCSLDAISSVSEVLSIYRNSKIFNRTFKSKQGYHMAIAEIVVQDELNLIDFRDAHQIIRMKTNPSTIATYDREVTQRLAKLIKEKGLDGLIWWSILEASWSNLALFESKLKLKKNIKVTNVTKLSTNVSIVENAADLLNIEIVS